MLIVLLLQINYCSFPGCQTPGVPDNTRKYCTLCIVEGDECCLVSTIVAVTVTAAAAQATATQIHTNSYNSRARG